MTFFTPSSPRFVPVLPGFLAFVLLVAPGLASLGAAQSISIGGTGRAIEILAEEGLEWQRDNDLYIARGNVVIKRGTMQLFADTVTAHYRRDENGEGNTVYRVEAEGRVRLVGPQEALTGERGVYLVDRGIAYLTGANLQMVTADERVTARDSLEYWEDYEGAPLAVARGNAEVFKDDTHVRSDIISARLMKRDAGAPQNDSANDQGNDSRGIERIDAIGGVWIVSGKDQARSEEGIYFVKEERAVLSRGVHITLDSNQLRGERAEINFKTRVSRLLPQSDQQIHGIITRPPAAE